MKQKRDKGEDNERVDDCHSDTVSELTDPSGMSLSNALPLRPSNDNHQSTQGLSLEDIPDLSLPHLHNFHTKAPSLEQILDLSPPSGMSRSNPSWHGSTFASRICETVNSTISSLGFSSVNNNSRSRRVIELAMQNFGAGGRKPDEGDDPVRPLQRSTIAQEFSGIGWAVKYFPTCRNPDSGEEQMVLPQRQMSFSGAFFVDGFDSSPNEDPESHTRNWETNEVSVIRVPRASIVDGNSHLVAAIAHSVSQEAIPRDAFVISSQAVKCFSFIVSLVVVLLLVGLSLSMIKNNEASREYPSSKSPTEEYSTFKNHDGTLKPSLQSVTMLSSAPNTFTWLSGKSLTTLSAEIQQSTSPTPIIGKEFTSIPTTYASAKAATTDTMSPNNEETSQKPTLTPEQTIPVTSSPTPVNTGILTLTFLPSKTPATFVPIRSPPVGITTPPTPPTISLREYIKLMFDGEEQAQVFTLSPTKVATFTPKPKPFTAKTSLQHTRAPSKTITWSSTLAHTYVPTQLFTTTKPTQVTTTRPTYLPTTLPSNSPTLRPTLAPTQVPTHLPITKSPIPYPSKGPTELPTEEPTKSPTGQPTEKPTKLPTLPPTPQPSIQLTLQPSNAPTKQSTKIPTFLPTLAPRHSLSAYIHKEITELRTFGKNEANDGRPTSQPTQVSTPLPTGKPTEAPTNMATKEPKEKPTENPTHLPTQTPTNMATQERKEKPTENPTHLPTQAPTQQPMDVPTEVTTKDQTYFPTYGPTDQPTQNPIEDPTNPPTWEPTFAPTKWQTPNPTTEPTKPPTQQSTLAPTRSPTKATETPTKAPTGRPTLMPTRQSTPVPTWPPTNEPTLYPTDKSSELPSLEPTPLTSLPPPPSRSVVYMLQLEEILDTARIDNYGSIGQDTIQGNTYEVDKDDCSSDKNKDSEDQDSGGRNGDGDRDRDGDRNGDDDRNGQDNLGRGKDDRGRSGGHSDEQGRNSRRGGGRRGRGGN